MRRLAGNWPVSEETMTAKIREFRAIYEANGHDRFAVAVHKIIHDSQYKFFPSVSEFLGFMPKSEKAFRRSESCECKGTGFTDAGFDHDGNHQVRRCKNPECLQILAGCA